MLDPAHPATRRPDSDFSGPAEHIASQDGRERATLPVEPGLRGSRVSFSFSVPPDQSATTEPSDNCIQWVVHLHRKLPGADLDQTFELPGGYHKGTAPGAAPDAGAGQCAWACRMARSAAPTVLVGLYYAY